MTDVGYAPGTVLKRNLLGRHPTRDDWEFFLVRRTTPKGNIMGQEIFCHHTTIPFGTHDGATVTRVYPDRPLTNVKRIHVRDEWSVCPPDEVAAGVRSSRLPW